MQVTFIMIIISLIFLGVFILLFTLVVRALLKYIRSVDVRKEKEEERRTKREARKAEREAARHKSEQEKPAEKIIGWWEKIRHKNEKKTESEVKEQMTENIAKDKNESAE